MVRQRGTAVLAFAGFVVNALIGFLLLDRSGRGDLAVFLKVECQLIEAFGLEPNRALR